VCCPTAHNGRVQGQISASGGGGEVLRASHGSPTGDGQSGHLPPRDMALVGLGAVDTRPLQHAAFGASIAIPLPETLEDVHRCMLLRGVRTPNALAELLMPAMALLRRLMAWRSPTPRRSPHRAGHVACRAPQATCSSAAGPQDHRPADVICSARTLAQPAIPILTRGWQLPGIILVFCCIHPRGILVSLPPGDASGGRGTRRAGTRTRAHSSPVVTSARAP
jgi:hypothetical protein